MNILSQILNTLVAFLFIYIMYLETFATSSKKTSKVFNIPIDKLEDKHLNILFKNQGVYNGLIGLALLYSTFISPNGSETSIVILLLCILVAIYGGVTSSVSIIFKQGLLPLLALLSILLSK